MEKIEYLVATMNRKNEKFLENMNIKDDVVIINQTNHNDSKIIEKGNQKIKFISVKERGLSRSRNRAIEESEADICVISDDDFVYYDNSSEKIVDAYRKYKDADIIAFYFHSSNERQRKKFNNRSGKINYLTSLKLCSAQITFKRKSLLENNIKFNENFGAGAEKYKSGEENIFLYECLRKGLKIYIEPVYILKLEERNEGSAWFEGYNKNFLQAKGAVYYQMTPSLYWLLNIQFAIRKRKLYKNNNINVFQGIKYMFEESKVHKEKTRKRIYLLGDVLSNTGPAIVNKNYYSNMEDLLFVCKSNNKLKRLLHLLLKIGKCDTLLIAGLSKFQLLGCKIGKLLNKKVIYLMHGYSKIEYDVEDIKKENRLLEETEELLLEKVDKIICVSQRFSELLKTKRPDLKDKIDFVNNGISKMKKYKNNTEKSVFTIISVGGGMKIKNNLAICKAINEIKDIQIKFIVIGKLGVQGNKIKDYKFVEYYENLPHEEVLEKMQQSDLYIQNSYFETFGLSITEAISKGCKILVSKNVGALSIMDSLNEDMIIVNNEDIQEIIGKIKLTYKRRNQKKEYIKNYNKLSWKEASKKLLNICMENTNENKKQ